MSDQYFDTIEALVEHCKTTNTILIASPRGLNHTECQRPEYALLYTVATRKPADVECDEAILKGFTYASHNIAILRTELIRAPKMLESDTDSLRRVSTMPIDRAFVYFDVSDFSKFTSFEQRCVVTALDKLTDEKFWNSNSAWWAKDVRNELESALCIGDGYIYVIKTACAATYFAARMAHLIELFVDANAFPVKFHFRSGAHFGPALCFWDKWRKDWNYIGDAINDAQRVLSTVGKDRDDICFISGQMRERIGFESTQSAEPWIQDIHSMLENRGRHKDKHDKFWRVFEIAHTRMIARANLRADLSHLPGVLTGTWQI